MPARDRGQKEVVIGTMHTNIIYLQYDSFNGVQQSSQEILIVF